MLLILICSSGAMTTLPCLVKYLKTILVCSDLLLVGTGISLIGSTKLDLEMLIKVGSNESGYLLPAQSIGYTVGSIFGGFMGDSVKPSIVSTYSLILSTISHAIVPLSSGLWIMLTALFVVGFALAQLEIASCVWIQEVCPFSSSLFTHAAYFFFGLGAFIGPLVVEPFLTPTTELTASDYHEQLRIKYPYLILSVYSGLSTILIIIIFALSYYQRTITSIDSTDQQDESQSTLIELSFSKHLIIIVISFCYSYIALSMDVAIGLVLMSFTVKSDVGMTKSQGAYLTSAFWAIYTFGRVIDFIAIGRLSNRSLNYLHLILITFSSFLMLLGYPNKIAIWVSVILIGLGLSSLIPLLFSYLQSFTKLTGRITAILLLAANLGDASLPATLEQLINYDPKVFLYISCALIIAMSILFGLLDLACTKQLITTNQDITKVSTPRPRAMDERNAHFNTTTTKL